MAVFRHFYDIVGFIFHVTQKRTAAHSSPSLGGMENGVVAVVLDRRARKYTPTFVDRDLPIHRVKMSQ